jgi:hypothetical protein
MMRRMIACSACIVLAALDTSAIAAQTYKSTEMRDPATIVADACEDVVGKSVEKMRGKLARRVQFMSDQREAWQASNAETGVKGAGQYQGPDGTFTPFTYDCVFNIRTGKVTSRQWRE